MAQNENDAGVALMKDAGRAGRTCGNEQGGGDPLVHSFFAHNELIEDAVSMPYRLLVPRHVITHPPPLAPALSRKRHQKRQWRIPSPRTPSLFTNDPENDAEAAYTPYAAAS